MATTAATTSLPVLDVHLQDAEPETVARTKRLLSRVFSSQGPHGLARTLHVPAERASRLKHRVACVTCRSRLDGLVAQLSSVANVPAAHEDVEQQSVEVLAEYASERRRGGPAPLAAWLVADAGLGLAPAVATLQDLGTLAGFLAAFASTREEIGEEVVRRNGRSSGIARCPYHTRCTNASGFPSCRSIVPADREREHQRTVAWLCSGMSEADWEALGSIDVDDTIADLFSWLKDRCHCNTCIDTVAGSLLELRRQCLEEDDDLAHPESSTERSAERVLEAIGSSCAASAGGIPEFVRVQGKLRNVCGVYRLEPAPFNDRPVYRKVRPGMAHDAERPEAYIVYTNLGDWMISGQMDAGGAKCEGWAYAMEGAESPDKICSTWRVSGNGGWEEDPSLCITAFESLSDEFRAGIGYEDGTVVSQHLACDDHGVLFVPLSHPSVLREVLLSPTERLPARQGMGECCHVNTPEAAQQELYAWIRWLLRERLEKQCQSIVTQAQVSHQLCRLFSIAAMQQLEQAAERLPSARKTKEKKGGRSKKTQDFDDELRPEIIIGDIDHKTSTATSPSLASPVPVNGWQTGDSDESASTRASSEEPPEAHRMLATKARQLMKDMGWESKVSSEDALEGSEVADWLQRHPEYRQAVRVGRKRLHEQFKVWANAAA